MDSAEKRAVCLHLVGDVHWTVMLVHGFVFASDYMMPIAHRLATLSRVSAVDLPRVWPKGQALPAGDRAPLATASWRIAWYRTLDTPLSF